MIVHHPLHCDCIDCILADFPPSSNTGGNLVTPPPLDEESYFEEVQKTKIDYLSISTLVKCSEVAGMFSSVFRSGNLQLVDSGRGWNGYPYSGLIVLNEQNIGIYAWGAQHGRNFLSFSGDGTSQWSHEDCLRVREILAFCSARITRIDIAMDFYKGEVTYEDCKAAFASGEFSLKSGGRKPSHREFLSTAQWGNAGRTLEVGGVKSSKTICCYEKGLEVFGKLAQKWEEKPTEVVLDSYRFDEKSCPFADVSVKDWMRLEVRYGNDDRDLDVSSHEIIVKRDLYFSGAYPFCARVIGLSDGKRPPTMMTNTQASVEVMKDNAKSSYGGLIYALRELGYTDPDIVKDLIGSDFSKRLKKAGVVGHIKSISRNETK